MIYGQSWDEYCGEPVGPTPTTDLADWMTTYERRLKVLDILLARAGMDESDTLQLLLDMEYPPKRDTRNLPAPF